MSYPDMMEYNEAVQDPKSAFLDPALKVGAVAETQLGLPLALSGGFALTYSVQSGSQRYAVRCFHREVPEAQSRYAAISARLKSLASPYFVDFDFQPQGIRVRGKSYPIVKMDWAEGWTLGMLLDRIANNQSALTTLRGQFSQLAAFLESNSVAHGDLQNDNIIIQPNGLRLIDYDGCFVAGMPEGRGSEVGQKNFQHPERGTTHFGPTMDRFSFIVLDVSLQALIQDSSLHRRYREGGQAIIFKANDFADPSSSEIFQRLGTMPALRDSARNLAAICSSPISAVPTLADFIAGRNIPIVAQRAASFPPPVVGYVSAFEVVDGGNYHAVTGKVGHKIEMIGRVVSVKHGTGKRGRGRGRPYVFVNFGAWNKNSAKITFWSEGLGNLTDLPNDSWVDKWVSVTGLVEPPYEGKHYGKAYFNVGITVVSENQIVRLSEKEAKFRLGGSAPGRTTKSPRTEKPKTTNEDILAKIKGGPHTPGTWPHKPSQPPSSPPKTTNQQILHTIQQSTGTRSAPTPPYATASRPNLSGSKGGIPWWVWIIGAAILLFIFFGR